MVNQMILIVAVLILVNLIHAYYPTMRDEKFDGVTIEEVGDSVHVDSTPTNINDEQQYYDENNQYEPKVKVYSF